MWPHAELASVDPGVAGFPCRGRLGPPSGTGRWVDDRGVPAVEACHGGVSSIRSKVSDGLRAAEGSDRPGQSCLLILLGDGEEERFDSVTIMDPDFGDENAHQVLQSSGVRRGQQAVELAAPWFQ